MQSIFLQLLSMRCLDLFSGSGSVAKALPEHEVISVDICKKFNPTICVDILLWDYKTIPTGTFDVIWASVPCTEYSKAKSRGVRDLEGADALVAKTLEIIRYFAPRLYFIENPWTGLLKHRDVVAGIPRVDLTYCKYGYRYWKPTCIWGTIEGFTPRFCRKGDRCDAFLHEHNRHPECITNVFKSMTDQKGYRLYQQGMLRAVTGVSARGAVPTDLIRELITNGS